MRHFFTLTLLTFLAFGFSASAQELYRDEQAVWRAEVVRVIESKEEQIPGTDISSYSQTLEVKLKNGERKGELITFRNDFTQLEDGDKFFLVYTKEIDGFERYAVQEVDRTFSLLILAILFVGAVVWLSGVQGVRSLVGLVGSIAAIFFVLIPLLLQGFPPVLTSVLVATGILAIALFLTHGFRFSSCIALLGTAGAVTMTGVLATVFAYVSKLSGFASDEAVYLNIATKGELDFVGLLLGGIIIGVIGVLDDIAITQVAVVRELHEHSPEMPPRVLYTKALRVGKEHVGALVNTLVLAYTGAALPLLLLFFQVSTSSPIAILNQEVLTTEIIRTLVGSIGLVLAVPITTALAVLWRGKLSHTTGHLHTHVH